MPDWKRGVRENLDLCSLEPVRQSEIVEDLAQQLDDAYQDGLARGMSDDQAAAFAWSQCPDWPGLSRELRQSRRGAVGVMGRLEGRACDAEAGGSRWAAWAAVAQELLFAARMMRKAPAFTAAAVLTLALGIGANSTIFSVMSATFLKPLPFPDPDRLALIWDRSPLGRGPGCQLHTSTAGGPCRSVGGAAQRVTAPSNPSAEHALPAAAGHSGSGGVHDDESSKSTAGCRARVDRGLPGGVPGLPGGGAGWNGRPNRDHAQ